MNRLIILAGVLGICCSLVATSVWAVPTPIFYTPLENEADSITALGGSTPDDDFVFVSGFSGNAFASSTNAANAGGYAQWSNTAVKSIFTDNGWQDSNGITIDHYFRSLPSETPSGVNEGMWAIVRRWTQTAPSTPDPTGLRDSYLFTSLQSGKLRIAFANDFDHQYKYTFNGSVCGGQACTPDSNANQERVQGQDITLNDGTIYHLTVSIGNGEFKVWLDDVGENANQYNNDAPKFVDSTVIPDGYNWNLPPEDPLTGVPNQAAGGQQSRVMTIGSRGPPGDFGGTLRNYTWVDEVKIYNGVYTPAQLVDDSEPLAGDHNGDLVVDYRDYVVWRADPDSNGGDDGYLTWAENYGEFPEGSGAGFAVPEPSIVALVMLSFCSLAIGSGRRR